MKHKFILFTIFLAVGAEVLPQNKVCINEVMADNRHTLQDEDGDFSPWIELYNPTDKKINLQGYGITNDPVAGFKWKFPAVSIPAKGYLLLFASGKNRVNKKNLLHTDFILNSDGQAILLTNFRGEVMDKIPAASCSADISFGRTLDGASDLERMSACTPGNSNNGSAGIVFSHQSGFYPQNFALKLISKNGDLIRYTLDGSVPDINSKIMKDTFPVTSLLYLPDSISYIQTGLRKPSPRQDNFKANVIRAATFNNGKRTSSIYTRTYFVSYDTNARYATMDVISLITDPNNLFNPDTGIYVPGVHFNGSESSGNYYQKGKAWERAACIQFFGQSGHFRFEQNVGIRIQGKIRRFAQKSLRICARSEYGAPKINYPLFDQRANHVFSRIVLRNSMSCWQKTLFKDECTAYICRDLNVEFLDSRPVIVFINGEYWGIHTIREYLNAEAIARNHNLVKDSVNIVMQGTGNQPEAMEGWGVEDGSAESHYKMYEFLHSHDLHSAQNYRKISQFLDLSSVIDYYCAEIFFNNIDWPGYNNKLWNNGKNGPWKQVFYDLDAGWMNPEFNTFNMLLSTGSTAPAPAYTKFLFQKLMESAVFRTDFLSRMACLLKNEFSEQTLLAAIDLFKFKYDHVINEHVGRWGIPGSVTQWERKITYLKSFAHTRTQFLCEQISTLFNVKFDPETYSCP